MGFILGQEFNLIGVKPLNWHLLMFFIRICCALLFFWLIRLIWINQKVSTLMMTLIFSTYPGFLLTPEAVTYQTLFLGINFGLLSIICSLYTINNKKNIHRIGLSIISCLSILFCLLMYEWFIGILGVGLILIFYEIKKIDKSIISSIRKTFEYSFPLILGTIFFSTWRLFIFKNTRLSTDIGHLFSIYQSQPAKMVFNIFFNTVRSFIGTVLMPWAVPLNNLWWLDRKSIIFQGLIFASFALIIVGVMYWIYRRNNVNFAPNNLDTWHREGMIIGFLCVLITMIPVTFSNRVVSLDGTFNRYTLNSIMGTSILVVSILYYLIKNTKLISIFIIVMLFLSIFTHYLNSFGYKELFETQNYFWWQLSWRAPNIKDNTVFIPVGIGFRDYYDIFPQINLIYRPGSKEIKISTQTLNSDTAKEILVSTNIQDGIFKGIKYQRNYKNILLVSKNENSCLHVWDGNFTELVANEAPILSLIVPLANISTIDTQSENHIPPNNIFGDEPSHNWCFFYQKAGLAKQESDWNTIVDLAKELNEYKFHPIDISEWLPFFEAYANLYKFEEAKGIALRMKSDMATVNLVCNSFTDEKPLAFIDTSDTVYDFMKQTLCE